MAAKLRVYDAVDAGTRRTFGCWNTGQATAQVLVRADANRLDLSEEPGDGCFDDLDSYRYDSLAADLDTHDEPTTARRVLSGPRPPALSRDKDDDVISPIIAPPDDLLLGKLLHLESASPKPETFLQHEQSLERKTCSGGRKKTLEIPAPAVPKAIRRNKREILCVDDDIVQLKLLKRFVEQTGHACTTLTSAEAALELLSRRAAGGGINTFPESVIMDIDLGPGDTTMNGIQAMQAMRERFPDAVLPVTLCSSDRDRISQGVSLQTDYTVISYLLKPVTRAMLGACIDSQATAAELVRCQKLLKSILPPSVVSRINVGPSRSNIISDYHEETTVLFSDVVGFTAKVATFDTFETMIVLHAMFSYFDCLTETFGVSKVETIGDAYMAVAGHDVGSRGDHAVKILQMATQMLKVADLVSWPDGTPVTIRVGIHTGSVHSGVLSDATRSTLRTQHAAHNSSGLDLSGLPASMPVPELVSLGVRSIKGKGQMQTWMARVGEWESGMKQKQEQEAALLRAPRRAKSFIARSPEKSKEGTASAPLSLVGVSLPFNTPENRKASSFSQRSTSLKAVSFARAT
eukprot:jgi/Tetstr1/435981/TSEL_024862.t1